MRAAWRLALGFGLAAAFYLLLIDTLDGPEILVGLVVAGLAALAYTVAGAEQLGGVAFDRRWLRRAWRPLAGVPAQIATVSLAALHQLCAPRPRRGRFVAVPFAAGDGPPAIGRIAVAEAAGSLAPNTIVIGVDARRGLLLVHQLPPGSGEAADVMGLG